MSSLSDSITHLIDGTIAKLTTIKEKIVDDVQITEDCIPILKSLGPNVSAIHNLLLYRDNLLGSSGMELSKKYNIKPSRVTFILKDVRSIPKSIREV